MCLSVMYACGLRISEATRLETGAIDRANLVLRIVGKGNKERLVALPQPILDELDRQWQSHHNRRWLFPNRSGDAPLNNRVLSRTFAAAANTAGIQRGVKLHALPTVMQPACCRMVLIPGSFRSGSEGRHTAHEHLVEGRITWDT